MMEPDFSSANPDEWLDLVDDLERVFADRRGRDDAGAPRVTVQDALLVVDRIAGALNDLVAAGEIDDVEPLTGDDWERRWADLVARFAGDDYFGLAPADRFPASAALFDELRDVARAIDHARARVDGLAARFAAGFRNATAKVEGDRVRFTDVKDWPDLLTAIVAHYAALHGDSGNDEHGRPIPKATVAEVLGQADYWSALTDEYEYDAAKMPKVQEALGPWRAIVAHMLDVIKDLGPGSGAEPYPARDAAVFWPALADYVRVLDAGRKASVQPEVYFWLDATKHITLPVKSEVLSSMAASVAGAAATTTINEALSPSDPKNSGARLVRKVERAVHSVDVPVLVAGAGILVGSMVLLPMLFGHGGRS
ncbi:MAG TPA: hypothetical protein VGM90_16315 [Kofleriaceae bacterium]|jgi:hypothetical protein